MGWNVRDGCSSEDRRMAMAGTSGTRDRRPEQARQVRNGSPDASEPGGSRYVRRGGCTAGRRAGMTV
ncbi:hypothetical protein DESPIG_03091 [Desulfovibrio piger ATCC 29098]|uniref:Uncharacterized protein n=1 Tax=Desulfovibrio piger ATCC 29098 TaxID=411464 RepID=B6WYB0_9BACT|nr:hypothetical protein DESPIG_03091 [Desulfovibrio piger ATCC 29098]